MSTERVTPLPMRPDWREPEPELFSHVNPPGVTRILSAAQREVEASWALARANQTIREHLRPTRAEVLKSLEAVHSMAMTLCEQGDCTGDIDGRFQDLFSELEETQPLTHEQAKDKAKRKWDAL